MIQELINTEPLLKTLIVLFVIGATLAMIRDVEKNKDQDDPPNIIGEKDKHDEDMGGE